MSLTGDTLDISTIIVSGATNLIVCVVLTSLFCLLRPIKKDIYEPRSLYSEKKLKPLPNGIFSWLPRTLYANETEILNTVGLDSLMMIKFIGFGVKMLVLLTTCAIPLMVLHFFAKKIDNVNVKEDTNLLEMSLDVLSITNIRRGSRLFYVHSGLAYIISFVAYYYLYKLWKDYIQLRIQYFKSKEFANAINNRMLLFTSIINPKAFSSELVKVDFEEAPAQILSGRDYSKLRELVKTHEKMTIEFEKVLVKYLEQNKTKRPTHKINKTLGIYGGDTVDSIEYYSKELKMLERLIYQQRSEPSDHFHLDGSAFVLFKSINACHRSEERIGNALSRNHLVQIFTTTPDLRLCPDIDDLVWENVGNSALEKRSRKLLAVGLTIGLTLGWFLLESLVQGASAFLTSFGDSPIPSNFRGLVTVYKSIITPSLLAGLNILLFLVLKYISKLQGVVTESGIERSALLKYFVFQIYRLLISVSASAVFAYAALFFSGQASNAQFNDLLGDLTKAAIRQSNVFLIYVNSGLTFYGIVIVQAAPFLLKFAKKYLLFSTPRALYELEKPPKFQYLENYGFLLTTLLIAMTYSLITPLILPFAAVSFALAYLVLKYQLLFVFETGVESGGVWWPRVFNLICFIIGFFQSITFGALVVLGARKGDARQAETKIPNLLITPLPFITVAFWLYGTFYLRTKVSRVPENIAKSISAPADSTNGNSRVALKGKIFNPAVVKILPKVWVKKNQEEELPNVYKPEFENLIDFVSKTKAPEAMASVQRQENQRHAHVQNFLRKITHRGRRTEAAVSNDTEVDLLPPEFDSL